ncbi:MAG: hypothetical protein JJLCMIEE_03229 [Acidimicrobiales bacterium]|nr:MAG: hypothetical protein EDR02_12545 [Actinomycetota bacterium]MBV6510109.1 hypothetical protein [Acidimicrobiales bacterium]RIK03601.1 MAG: hypothetical protein DCC48_16295 [Acidobacteriota bacterium]
MSRSHTAGGSPPRHPDSGTSVITVLPWSDPVIDLKGFDPRSTYVERFWLSVIGPSTLLLLRRFARGFDEHRDGFAIDLADTAVALGLAPREGRNSPFVRALHRSEQFGLARFADHRTLKVRRRVPPLTRRQVQRLPEPVQRSHARWLEAELRRSHNAESGRARRLALTLAQLGEDLPTIEVTLERWNVEAALSSHAARWAIEEARRSKVQAP